MPLLFVLLNCLFAVLQKTSLFGLNGLILPPNRIQNRTAKPPCGAHVVLMPLPYFIPHPSSFIPSPSGPPPQNAVNVGGMWGCISENQLFRRATSGPETAPIPRSITMLRCQY
jgi:hypothetical protein